MKPRPTYDKIIEAILDYISKELKNDEFKAEGMLDNFRKDVYAYFDSLEEEEK